MSGIVLLVPLLDSAAHEGILITLPLLVAVAFWFLAIRHI